MIAKMSTTFDITPEELKISSNRILSLGNEWVKEVNAIYAAVDGLKISYKGEASETFTKQLEGYENDFKAALKALEEYVVFLSEYAYDMYKLEGELIGLAANLPSRNKVFCVRGEDMLLWKGIEMCK